MNSETHEVFDIPKSMASQLGYYVYLYQHPDTGIPLYIGKGKGERILSHMAAEGDSDKAIAIRALLAEGKQPVLKFVRHGLTEDEAFLVESALIDVVGLGNLTNVVSGHYSSSLGMMSFDQLRSKFVHAPVQVADPVLLIRLPRSFRYDMTKEELFEATCGIWKVGEKRDSIKYVLAVYDEVVQEVFEVTDWQEGGTRTYSTRDISGFSSGRWEFNGFPVKDLEVRQRYLYRSVKEHFPRGSQNSIRYLFPCDS